LFSTVNDNEKLLILSDLIYNNSNVGKRIFGLKITGIQICAKIIETYYLSEGVSFKQEAARLTTKLHNLTGQADWA
jgi:hypothetical protein